MTGGHRSAMTHVDTMEKGTAMATLMVDFIVSLDGHTTLMGANTYRLMSHYAQSSDDDSFAELTAALSTRPGSRRTEEK